jgi:hypothetical protein
VDPLKPEAVRVTTARIVSVLLLELAGSSFLLSLMLFFAVEGALNVRGLPGKYVVSALGSLAGLGLLGVLFLRKKS